MGRIRSRNTKPEMIVRSLLHKMGYRFRLHTRVLTAILMPMVGRVTPVTAASPQA